MATRRKRRMLLAALVVASVGLLGTLPAAAGLNLSAGDGGWVVDTGGDGLNLRADPGLDADIITTLPDGAALTIADGPVTLDDGSGWYAVTADADDGEAAGWVSADYVSGAVVDPDSFVSDADSAATGVPIIARTGGATVEIYAEPSADSDLVGSFPDGSAVETLGPAVADEQGVAWSAVRVEGVTGYSQTELLGAAETALDAAAGGDAGATLAAGERGDTDGAGQALVDAAMGYLGTPYLWGGVTPEGFDCSGFTYYIVNQVLGNDFPRPNEDQAVSGDEVAVADLQPGDLVFFQNTYQWGLSHVGFYIGDGQFISASGEHDSVGVSNLNDPYWAARYLTARRVR